MLNQSIPILRASLFLVSMCFASLTHAEPGVTKTEILIGESIGLTGVASEQCQTHVAGHNLYFNKINKEGGINGRKIRVITYDDGYDPMRTLANAKKLISEDQVFLLFKVYGTPTIKAILPLINDADIPVVSPSSGAEFIRNPVNRNIFHLKSGFHLEAKTMIDFLVGKKKFKKIAIFYQDDSFGNEGRTGTVKALDKFNLKPVVETKYKRIAEEFETEFKAITDAKPDAVILWSLSATGVQFIQRAKKEKLKAILMGNSSMSTAEFAKEGEEHYLTLPVPPPETKGIKIIEEFNVEAKKAGVGVNPTSLQSYLDAALLVDALTLAGKDPTRDSLRKAFESMNARSLGGLPLTFSNKDHEGLNKIFLSQVKDGKFVTVP